MKVESLSSFRMTESSMSEVNPLSSDNHTSTTMSGGSDEGNPNLRLCSVLLNEYNYLSWSRAVTLALGGKSKLGFVNGVISMPEINSATYDTWLSKDHLVMSWLLNSMEPKIAEIFNYSESSMHLWKDVKEMYGNQNNSARVFQLKRDIANLQQEEKSFVQYLGSLTSMWNELDLYRPHTIDAAILSKRAEEDKIFQLLANLSAEYEDLRSHILMNSDLPSFKQVCATVQREELRRKVMKLEVSTNLSDSRAYATSHKSQEERVYRGRRPELKCSHCSSIGRSGIGHTRERCWILHPELKLKFQNKNSSQSWNNNPPKANIASSSESIVDFTTNPAALINEFAVYLQQKQGKQEQLVGTESHTALLGKFAGFLADAGTVNDGDISGILNAFKTALDLNTEHDYWIIDSGATDHMTNDINLLHDFEKLTSHVSVANGKGASVLGKGKIEFLSTDIKSDALYVPSFPVKLLSVGKITRTLNCLAIFSPHKMIFQDITTKKKIGEGFFLNGLYYLSKKPKALQVSFSNASDHHIWHQRLAHPSEKVLSILFPTLSQESKQCEVCHLSKFARLPFNSSVSRACKPFEIVHSDIWGPILESFDGFRYFVTFIDDFTRITWLYLLKHKSETFNAFTDFYQLVSTQFSSKIQTLRSDNGSEYMSNKMKQFLSFNGVVHQTSCVGTPQQNGIAERKNRDLLEKTRAIMFNANIPKKYWSQAVLTATYLINRLPSRVLNSKSPLEVLKNRKIDLSHLKVFGCICYVHIQANTRDKLDPRAVKCVFLGYSSTQKGYKCFNPSTRKLMVSRDVKFDESSFFFPDSLDVKSQGEYYNDLFPLPIVCIEDEFCIKPSPSNFTSEQEFLQENENENDDLQAVQIEREVSNEQVQDAPSSVPPRRNPSRARKPPLKLQDFVSYTSKYPISKYMSYSKLSSTHNAYLSAIDHSHEPQTFEDASQHEVWKQAMDNELAALDENKTWSVMKLPKGKKAVGSRWIYKTKFNADGTIERHKARLVARGFTQTYGVDYKETFAPVAKMNTVRVLLSVAVNKNWSLHQMDVKNAFLHGELQEEVYMKLPPGHSQFHESDMVCRLHKAIYGLKQSPRAWYAKLSSVLEEVGFCRSNADSSLFVRNGSSGKLIVLIYVDDLIITGDSSEEIMNLKQSLQSKFSMKDLGALKYFLGIEMAASHKGLFLSQRKYILDLLTETKILESKPVRTPLDSRMLLDTPGDPLFNLSYYQRLVGKLIYLTITRPDISYAVSIVSQFMHAPTNFHLSIVKRILRYLKGSVGRGIIFKNNGNTSIVGFVDADWAGNALDRKSTTGYCTFVGGNIVTWRSKKQSVVARSSAEAEYRAMASAACELIWLKGLLCDLGFLQSTAMPLHCDNQAAMHIASNPVFHERTKHIEVDCHYIRNQVQSQVIATVYTRSEDQLADIFTKSLSSAQFQNILGKLGSINLLDPS